MGNALNPDAIDWMGYRMMLSDTSGNAIKVKEHHLLELTIIAWLILLDVWIAMHLHSHIKYPLIHCTVLRLQLQLLHYCPIFLALEKFNECKNWLLAKAMLTEWKWLKSIQNSSRGHLPLITQMSATVLNVNNLSFRFFWFVAFNPFCLPQFTKFFAMLFFFSFTLFVSLWSRLLRIANNLLFKMELNRFNAVNIENHALKHAQHPFLALCNCHHFSHEFVRNKRKMFAHNFNCYTQS